MIDNREGSYEWLSRYRMPFNAHLELCHWEGDLLSGAKNSYIATLVERPSRFAMPIKVPNKEREAVVAALSQYVRNSPLRCDGR